MTTQEDRQTKLNQNEVDGYFVLYGPETFPGPHPEIGGIKLSSFDRHASSVRLDPL